ncbi:hypothetical protein POJ06DRAFT_242048 [Lipomyces tetrasporus]|uniref:Secreted protein n=1 Tax=Lipomyces tetrasporus TaxID=54092 RepID=A0AAD7VVW7_9ASCO|nr:uncharacterized protein POJ06DRAFT_242048 [Lipomyces tetrasporus]KAJ8103496.1 hypothetical protein POJ06DRAFT_242048 [Lipomyces tetrasporus]
MAYNYYLCILVVTLFCICCSDCALVRHKPYDIVLLNRTEVSLRIHDPEWRRQYTYNVTTRNKWLKENGQPPEQMRYIERVHYVTRPQPAY